MMWSNQQCKKVEPYSEICTLFTWLPTRCQDGYVYWLTYVVAKRTYYWSFMQSRMGYYHNYLTSKEKYRGK